MLVVGLGIFAATLALAGPAIGWYVDTRVFPGDPPGKVREYNDDGQMTLVDAYDHDTGAVTAWLLVPYSIYGAIFLTAAGIFIGVNVSDSRKELKMSNIFQPIPSSEKLEKFRTKRENYEAKQIAAGKVKIGGDWY